MKLWRTIMPSIYYVEYGIIVKFKWNYFTYYDE